MAHASPKIVASLILAGLQMIGGVIPVAPACGLAADRPLVQLTLRVRVPSTTASADTIAVVADFRDWNYEAADLRLQPRGDGSHEITLEVESGTTISFRFHRGGPERQEVRPDGSPLDSRRLAVNGSRSLDLRVAAWADDPIEAAVRTMVGDVAELSDSEVLDGRRIWVYLPPGYHDEENAARSYPMMLMLDGQNVFDASTSFAGEWKVDESCETLIEARRIEPLVVVAVDNGQSRRVHEYTPWPDPTRAGGGGSEHLSRLVDELLPWIRARYRVETAPDRVGFAGSSLGGLMSLHAVVAHPSVFARVAALSPSLHWAGGRIARDLRGRAPREGERLWVDMGGLESGVVVDQDGDGIDDSVEALRALGDGLRAQGWSKTELRIVVDEGARHHEAAWARRFATALEFLFPARR